MNVKKIILVYKTHCDIGFTDLASHVIRDYSGPMMDRVSETCDATRDMGKLRYIWTMPAWPLWNMREHADAALAARIDDLVMRGQLVWHALPYTSHYDVCGIEDAVWGLRYSALLSERYQLPRPVAAKMTDVPGQGRFLVEILAEGGIQFLHMGSNTFPKVPEVPMLFFWEAPSGKRVLTMYNTGYGTPLLPPQDWPYATWMVLLNTAENFGPQSVERVLETVETLRKHFPDAEILSGTMDDFARDLFQEDLKDVPVVRSDLADTWIHGAGSYPVEVGQLRRLRNRLRTLESLSMRADPDVAAQVQAHLNRAWDAMALFTEHTWGLDVKTHLGVIRRYDDFERERAENPGCRLMEASWEEQRDRIREAEEACRTAGRLLNVPEREQAADPSGWTELHGEQSMDMGHFRILFSADTGTVHEVQDRKLGCSVLKQRGASGVFSFRYDLYGADEMTEYLRKYARRFSDWGVLDNGRAEYPECEHRTARPEAVMCRKSRDAVEFHYRMVEGTGAPARVVLSLSSPGSSGTLRVRLDLLDKKPTPYVESGMLCIPLTAEHPRYDVNKTGYVLNPETDIAPGANHAFYALEHFVGAEGEKALTVIASRDCPLISLGESGVFQYHAQYEEREPEIRLGLFNTMWGTNFPQWISGDMSFTLDLWDEVPGSVTQAYLKASALAEAWDDPEERTLPFQLTGPVRVAGIRKTGNRFFILLHSCSGVETGASLEMPGMRLRRCDLLGNPADEIQWKDQLTMKFAPYELQAWLLEAEKP